MDSMGQVDGGTEPSVRNLAARLLLLLTELRTAMERFCFASDAGRELAHAKWHERLMEISLSPGYWELLGELAGAFGDKEATEFQQRISATLNATVKKFCSVHAYTPSEALNKQPLARQREFVGPYCVLRGLQGKIRVAFGLERGQFDRMIKSTEIDRDSLRASRDQNPGKDTKAGQDADQKTASQPAAPEKNLANWREILIALGETNTAESRQKVRRLNDSYGGPIVMRGQGTQPFVSGGKLLEWWDHLSEIVQSREDRARDAAETVKVTHAFGRNGEVVPEISGSVKRRRADRKP